MDRPLGHLVRHRPQGPTRLGGWVEVEMKAGQMIPTRLRSLLNRGYFRVTQGVKIGPRSQVNLATEFEGCNVVGADCLIGDCRIGFGTYIAERTVAQRVRFGRYCSCGSDVTVSLGRHPTSGFASTHPAFFSLHSQAGFTFIEEPSFEEHIYVDPVAGFRVHIGNDVWIGNGVRIMDGVTIHDGAVVGAGAVVTKDIEPYCIVAGVPARVVRRRFDEKTARLLRESCWWDLDPTFLKIHGQSFSDVHVLLELLAAESRGAAGKKSRTAAGSLRVGDAGQAIGEFAGPGPEIDQ